MKKMQNKFKYKLTDRLGTLDVFILGESNLSIEYSKDEKDANFDYKKELSGKITFQKEGFARLMSMENSIYRCEEQMIEIIKVCNGVEKVVFAGRISLNEAEFNLDKCLIVLKFMKDDKNQCFENGKSDKKEMFSLIPERVTVKTSSFATVFESLVCQTDTNPTSNTDYQYWCGTETTPEEGNWTCVDVFQIDSNRPSDFYNETKWLREVIEVDCSEVPEIDWILIEDLCPSGKKKFAKKVEVINCESRQEIQYDQMGGDDIYRTFYHCSVLGYSGFNTQIDNGVLFKDFMIQLLQSVCPELTLKSDFFQINPDTVTSTNYVTNKKSNVDQIVVFQKSDVKRPNTSGNATKMEVKLNEVLESLLQIFFVKWRIIGTEFRLEHVSFFQKGIGIDVTSESLKKYFVGKNVYSYNSAKIPKSEAFRFKEQGLETWGTEVIYSNCVSKDAKEGSKVIVDGVMTDIMFALNNPEPDNKNVTDNGLVFVSTKKETGLEGDQYFINSESTPNGRVLNNVFSFPVLFRNFHHYERPVKNGKVDGVETEFITSIPLKKGIRFSIPFSICSEFNPDDLIKTKIGNGIVDSASYRFKSSMIELDLLYESNN